jgi:hypothetical protein
VATLERINKRAENGTVTDRRMLTAVRARFARAYDRLGFMLQRP